VVNSLKDKLIGMEAKKLSASRKKPGERYLKGLLK
jgi:hypothetical protein